MVVASSARGADIVDGPFAIAAQPEGLERRGRVISRIWHGWTTPSNAEAYETLLRTEILPGIAAREVPGYRGAHLMRRDAPNEIEFVTILWFDSIDSVRSFAGEDYEAAYVPPKAQAALSRFDERSSHYETLLSPPPTAA